jgi:hypothetical protein
MICCKSGLVGKEHFAIDGCKLPSDASRQWSGTHIDLKRKSDKLRNSAKKIIDHHLSSDSNKDPGNKDRELKTADTLIRNADKIDEFLSTHDKRMGVGKRKTEVQSNITDNDSTKMMTSKGALQGFNCQAASDELYQVVVGTDAAGVGQDQSLLKPMVELIKNNLGDDVFDNNALLTADTGYSSEANMEYVFTENINAVIPDTNFRQRDPKIAGSETVRKHKEQRKKTRKDQRVRNATIPAEEFAVDHESKLCICPNGKEMTYLGDHYESARGRYMRFRGKLADCRSCSMQQDCMKNPVKDKGRQVSFLVEGQSHTSYLDLMKAKIDSEAGRKAYAKRMWTIEPVFGNITSNKGLNKLSLRGKVKVNCQWMMYCMVHNMEKLWRYGGNTAAT